MASAFWTALVLVSFAGLCGCAPERTRPLHRYLDELEAQGEWSGAVLIAERGRVLLERAAGTEPASTSRYTPESAFPLASITKTLTATAILQLAEAGAIGLDQSAAEILSGFPYRQITVRHLLSHTSGLPPYNAFFASELESRPDAVFTNADFLARLRASPAPLRYSPGSDGNYDNVNYIVLALVIERIAKTPYQDYVAQHILGPAGMSQTRLLPLIELLTGSSSGTVAQPHLYPHLYSSDPVSAAGIPYIASYWSAYRFLGFSDYVSTLRDLHRFDRALAHATLLNPSTLDAAHAAVALTDGSPNPGRLGLGWQVGEDVSLGRIVWHSGASVGLSTVLIRNLSRDQCIAVFDNAHFTAEAIGTTLMRLLNGESVPPRRRSLATRLGRTMVEHGARRALEEFHRLRADTASWHVTERELNALGYDFMGRPGPYRLPVVHRYEDALVVFELNTELHPDIWNVWDSYGEALAAVGRADDAAAMYAKAIELNPESESSKAKLEMLRAALRTALPASAMVPEGNGR